MLLPSVGTSANSMIQSEFPDSFLSLVLQILDHFGLSADQWSFCRDCHYSTKNVTMIMTLNLLSMSVVVVWHSKIINSLLRDKIMMDDFNNSLRKSIQKLLAQFS
jgi:hypothetical protein